MSRHPLRKMRHFFPTIRFMLVLGGMVAFALGVVAASDVTQALQNLGWFLVCATVLFLDPENPPGTPVSDDESEDEYPLSTEAIVTTPAPVEPVR